jgi:hypothetical protein
MSAEDLRRLRLSAEAVFAPGHGAWIGPDKLPGMSLPKADMLWLLDELERLRAAQGAAPEMLEALRGIAQVAANAERNGIGWFAGVGHVARAAIAKATGGAP